MVETIEALLRVGTVVEVTKELYRNIDFKRTKNDDSPAIVKDRFSMIRIEQLRLPFYTIPRWQKKIYSSSFRT